MASLEDVVRIAGGLPEVVEGERYGYRTWAVSDGRKPQAFAWERPFSKADIKRFGAEPVPEGVIVAVRVEDLGEKEAVLGAGRPGFFTIPHFEGYAAVLLQLEVVADEALEEAIVDGWLAVAPEGLAQAYVQGSKPG